MRITVRQRPKQSLRHTEVSIEIDGVRHTGAWGAQDFDVVNGEHRVAVSFRYCRGARGRSERRVVVPAGAIVELDYEAPRFMFWTRGRMDSHGAPAARR